MKKFIITEPCILMQRNMNGNFLGLEESLYRYQMHEVFSRRLERYPSEDVQCFDSITEPSSEKHKEKISNMIFYTTQVKCIS